MCTIKVAERHLLSEEKKNVIDENSRKYVSEKKKCLFLILQLVWYNSYQVGCAVAYCPRNQYNYFYVCHYCPP